jgi:hypothetical protein
VLRAALHAAPATIATDLAQPLPVVTSWHGYGAALWGVLALVIAIAGAGLFGALRLLRTADVDPRVALALIGASALVGLSAALSWPVAFSSDVYAYAAYGDEALRGIDPYAPPPHVSDAFLSAAAWQWSGAFPVCVYGTAFVAFARTLVAASDGLGVAATLLVFRIAASLAYLLACACLYFLLPIRTARPHSRTVVVAAFALNPVALWTAAEGHNDTLMLLLAVAGAAVAARGFPALGGVSLGLASLIKLPGMAIGLALAAFDELERSRRVRRLWPSLVTGALLVAVFGLPRALGVARAFGGHARYAPQFSLQALGVAAVGTLSSGSFAVPAGIALALLICAGLALRGVIAAVAGDSSGIAWIAIALWLAIPNPYPWYGLWVLPVAVLALERASFVALYAATISIAVRYLPDAYGPLSADQQIVIALVALAPLLYAVLGQGAFRSREELATS